MCWVQRREAGRPAAFWHVKSGLREHQERGRSRRLERVPACVHQPSVIWCYANWPSDHKQDTWSSCVRGAVLGLEDLGRAADGGASVAWADEQGRRTHTGSPALWSVSQDYQEELQIHLTFICHQPLCSTERRLIPLVWGFHFISPRSLVLMIMQSALLISFSN